MIVLNTGDEKVKVRNMKGTEDNTCYCPSWEKHWEKFSGKPSFMCNAAGCNVFGNLDGAHVQLVGYDTQDWYIIPLCRAEHHKSGLEVELDKNTYIVSANVSQTCGKGKTHPKKEMRPLI